jgi:hypothetical protein
LLAYTAYFFLGWIGFALYSVFLVGWYGTQMIASQQVIMGTLLSRLPDRCAFCHREIVDVGGVFDEKGMYHELCSVKLDSLESLRMEEGVPFSQAIHRARARSFIRK